MPATELPLSLTEINNTFFSPLNLELTEIKEEKESREYSAYTFRINKCSIVYRNAKITPTKAGQFVTIWKRNVEGITQPYENKDAFDFMIIETRLESKSGIFVFPKEILLQKDIILGGSNKGKRGMRIYPSWDNVTNKQAEKTQKWQLDYFLETTTTKTFDTEKARKLFSLTLQ
ncbi:MepB family protein [Flavobacterium amniphilum]|uniref:MepB family protein n=1 Tax=Flavobacterium amniphilum TaxID=1834035 RepID=UPI00202A2EDF|nr:MepB family protein [Flavobacterium amniphilum]MCL9807536.1 MepB family protein [Flavobacterium amniphilum]